MTALASIIKSGHRKFVAISMASGLALSGTLVWSASNAAFTGYTTNPSNAWTTGSVTLTDDDTGGDPDSGTALFTATNLVPGQTETKCIRVNYTGSAPAKVRVHAVGLSDAQTLGQYVELQIDEGTGTAEFDGTPACTLGAPTFTLDKNVYGAALAGDVAAFGAVTTWGGGFPQASEWSPSGAETRVYRITWRLDPNTPSATHQGKTCSVGIRWTASTV